MYLAVFSRVFIICKNRKGNTRIHIELLFIEFRGVEEK